MSSLNFIIYDGDRFAPIEYIDSPSWAELTPPTPPPEWRIRRLGRDYTVNNYPCCPNHGGRPIGLGIIGLPEIQQSTVVVDHSYAEVPSLRASARASGPFVRVRNMFHRLSRVMGTMRKGKRSGSGVVWM
ncbi:hypothetical protein PNOK_0823900 [Pyrrhoderma noxium]|uniref:Uncharacterized protein n=1 Tax=Pyrrhoderma noxium TaxID=2282107 RepID=A0A286UAM5_9AGAM|nr:hypothetical protein PNOK_0823900 [Pyrrhoderma noxium]